VRPPSCNAKHKGIQTCPFRPLCYWVSQIIFTPIISAIETGLQSQLILKGWCESEVDFEKQKRLQIQSISLSSCNNIKTVNLSTLYITFCYAWWIYFFNRQSSFLWVPTVFLFSSISTFSRLRHTSYRGFSGNMKRRKAVPLISLSTI
jgi:hypothetical protein